MQLGIDTNGINAIEWWILSVSFEVAMQVPRPHGST